MESSSLLSIFLSVSFLLLFSWVLRLLYILWWKPKKLERYLKIQGIHGPPYRFVCGNSKEMRKLAMEVRSKPMSFSHDIVPRLNPFLYNMRMKYGKVFVHWMGTTPQVVITDQMLIKDILTNKSGDFIKTKITLSSKLFTSGVISYDGDKWAKHRRIINPAFHMEKLKRMLPAFSICCEELIEKWDKMVTSAGSCELDMCHEFQILTGDVISRAAFGSSFEEGRRIFELQREQAKLFLKDYGRMYSSNFSLFPAKVSPRRIEIHEEVRNLLMGIIKKREMAFEMGSSSVSDDLLGLLMESNLNESRENRSSENAAMTMEDVIEECKLFYFAGQETTSNLLTWTMILLSMHSSWQERAREEILQVLGKNKPNFNDLNRLKIVSMIFHEVLRLYPPSSILRRTRKRTKLGEFFLPQDIQIMVPLHLVHRDPEQWGNDAIEFNPERFSDGISKASKDQLSYFPFGWGPRICVGQNFALTEAKMVLAMILQKFSFELSPSYAHAPSIIVTLVPSRGAQVILHKL